MEEKKSKVAAHVVWAMNYFAKEYKLEPYTAWLLFRDCGVLDLLVNTYDVGHTVGFDDLNEDLKEFFEVRSLKLQKGKFEGYYAEVTAVMVEAMVEQLIDQKGEEIKDAMDTVFSYSKIEKLFEQDTILYSYTPSELLDIILKEREEWFGGSEEQ